MINLEDPFAEIRLPQDTPCSLKVLGEWLNKYRNLYKYVNESLECRVNGKSCVMGVLYYCTNQRYKRDCRFADDYKTLEEWYEAVRDQEQYKKIVEEFLEVKDGKMAVVKWVMKYEELGEKSFLEKPNDLAVDYIEIRYSEAFRQFFWDNVYYVAKYRGEI